MGILGKITRSAALLAALASSAGNQWYFLPNYTYDIRGIEARPMGDERFHSAVPEKVKKLADGNALPDILKNQLFWHPATFPNRDFVDLMPMRKAFGWYACEFNVPEHFTGMDVLADLGIVDDSDETFVNGRLVGSTGKVPGGSAWQADRLYRIPSAGMTPFFNYMTVHVWSLWGLGGIAGQPVLKAALAASDAQWDIAFIGDAEPPKGGLNAAATLEGAKALLPSIEKTAWRKASIPWTEYSKWKDDAHYAVFKLAFDLHRSDGSPRLFEEDVVIDIGAVFDVAAFYLNGRRVGMLGRFPEGSEPAFTEATQRAQFIAKPEDWSKDGHNTLVAIVYRESGTGGLTSAPGILLEDIFDEGASFAIKSDAFHALAQSERLDEAEELLEKMEPSSDVERAWLLSHRAHLAFLKWLEGGGKDNECLDGVLAPVAKILSELPVESPKQSAMQAFCRVLRLAETDAAAMSIAKRHFPSFSDGCIALQPDRITKGDWMLRYGEGFRVLCGSGQIADNKGGSMACKYRLESPGKKDYPRYWLPNYQRDLASHSAMPVPLPLYTSIMQKSELSVGDVYPQMFPAAKVRRACWWDDHGEMHPFDDEGPDLIVHIEKLPETESLISAYMMDYDWCTTGHPRQQSVMVFSEEGAFLNAVWTGKTGQGVYERFMTNGRTRLKLRFCKHRGACVAVSGIFVDRSRVLPPFLPTHDGTITDRMRKFHAQRRALNGGAANANAQPMREEAIPEEVVLQFRRMNAPNIQAGDSSAPPLSGEVAEELFDLYEKMRTSSGIERIRLAMDMMSHEKELLSRQAGSLGLYLYASAADSCFASHSAMPSVLRRLGELDAVEALGWLSEMNGIEHADFGWSLIATASMFEKVKGMSESDQGEIIYRLAYANGGPFYYCTRMICANFLGTLKNDSAKKRGQSMRQWLPVPMRIDGAKQTDLKERQK